MNANWNRGRLWSKQTVQCVDHDIEDLANTVFQLRSLGRLTHRLPLIMGASREVSTRSPDFRCDCHKKEAPCVCI